MMEKDIKAESETAKRQGKVMPFESKMEQAAAMIQEIHNFYQQRVLIVADSWFGNDGLWSRLDRGQDGCFDLLTRMRKNNTLYDFPLKPGGKRGKGRPPKYGDRLGSVDDCAVKWKEKAQTYTVFLYGKEREIQAYSQVVMLKTLRCPVRVVWVYRKTRYVALMTTDMALSIEQIVEYYGARWKIESGFKEIKQEIGSSKSQVRKADAVINHLNFCMMATTLTWVYADRLQTAPDRKFKIRGRSGFAFSDVRRIMAEAALNEDFHSVCPLPVQKPQKSFIKMLLRMVA
jgi:transposase